MKTSLFTQSLSELSVEDAIATTAKLGYEAIELACYEKHFGVDRARNDPASIAGLIDQAGLEVAALSLFNTFTNPSYLADEIKTAEMYIRLAPILHTRTVKLTPGPPASAEATEEHWRCLATAIDALVPVATSCGVRLAFETHMKQLTDTIDSSVRLLNVAATNTVGLTADFSNLAFAGEKMPDLISAASSRIYHTHIKNGYVDDSGGWHFQALDTGLTDYSEVLFLLETTGYQGYLSVECLGSDAKDQPVQTARRDLAILQSLLKRTI